MGNKSPISFIVALMPRLNENNIQFIMNEYLERTDDEVFDTPSDIFECFKVVGKRRAYDVFPVDNIDVRLQDGEITLTTDDLDGWFEFNCIIQIRRISGKWKSEKIYLYVPSEFISGVDTFTIDLERGEEENDYRSDDAESGD